MNRPTSPTSRTRPTRRTTHRTSHPVASRPALAILDALADRMADADDFEGLESLAELFDRHDNRGAATNWPSGWTDFVAVTLA
jgi:hypothetical protein